MLRGVRRINYVTSRNMLNEYLGILGELRTVPAFHNMKGLTSSKHLAVSKFRVIEIARKTTRACPVDLSASLKGSLPYLSDFFRM